MSGRCSGIPLNERQIDLRTRTAAVRILVLSTFVFLFFHGSTNTTETYRLLFAKKIPLTIFAFIHQFSRRRWVDVLVVTATPTHPPHFFVLSLNYTNTIEDLILFRTQHRMKLFPFMMQFITLSRCTRPFRMHE